MKNDLFSSLSCVQRIYELEVMTVSETTWIVPASHISSSTILDLCSCKEGLVSDFLKLGNYLDRLISVDEYPPLSFEDNIVGRLNNDQNVSLPLLDQHCPFLIADYAGVVNRVHSFFSKYGMPDSRDVPNTVVKTLIPLMAARVFKTKKLHQIMWPISALTYMIYEIYLRYTKPELYLNNWYNKPPAYISKNHPASFNINIKLDVIYNLDGEWEERKTCATLFDYIILFIIYNDRVYVRECPYCKRIYTTENERSVYCDPVCRNRANAKKSYDRKKQRLISAEISKTIMEGNHGQEE